MSCDECALQEGYDNLFPVFRANLSRDYFVDRQDRYFLFENCPNLTDYFADLVNRVAAHSYTLQRDGSTKHPKATSSDPLSSRRTAQLFRTSLASAVRDIIQPRGKEVASGASLDTVVYPLIQMGYYGIRQDELATQQVLSDIDKSDQVYLASGYFNLPPQYTSAIFKGRGKCHVLAASPQVYTTYCLASRVDSSFHRQMVSMVEGAWQVTFQ